MQLQEQVIYHLRRQPRLHIDQIARLLHPAAPLIPLPNNRTRSGAYEKTRLVIQRMIKNNKHRPIDEQLEIHEVPLENGHNWIVLKGTEKLRLGKYEHETVKGDVYVAFQQYCDEWVNEWVFPDLISDATVSFRGARLHLEIDLGNMEPAKLFSKIDRYIQYAGPGEKVIFLLRDGHRKASTVGTAIIDFCRERRLGNFVTATLLENFLEFP